MGCIVSRNEDTLMRICTMVVTLTLTPVRPTIFSLPFQRRQMLFDEVSCALSLSVSLSLVTNTRTLRNKCNLLADRNIAMHVPQSHTTEQKTRHFFVDVVPRRSFFFPFTMNLY